MEEVTRQLVEELLGILDSLKEIAPMIWRTLVYQQVLIGIQNIAWFVFFGVGAAVLTKIGFVGLRHYTPNEKRTDWAVGAGLLWLGAFVLAAVALSFAVDGFSRFLNPSYYAIVAFVDQLK